MSSPGQLAAIIASVAVISVVLELVRRRLLSESLSLIWLVVAGGMVVASTVGFRFLIDRLAPLMGIRYPPSALILLAVVGLVALSLYFSVRMTRLNEQSRRLAQRVALLELMMREKEAAEPASGHQPDEADRAAVRPPAGAAPQRGGVSGRLSEKPTGELPH